MKWLPFFRRKARPRSARSFFPAAAINRLTLDFLSPLLSADEALRYDLRTLRDRARALERGNPHYRALLLQIEKNVIGSNGVGLQSKVKFVNGRPDTRSNTIIETEWWNWGKKPYTTLNRRLTWHGVQRLALRSLYRDGEILIRKRLTADSPYGLRLQLIEADYLDETYNDSRLSNGNKVSMSVELDRDNAPVAYHLLTQHPGSCQGSEVYGKRVRVPAPEIIHVYIPDRVDQSRGSPWAAAAMLSLHHLDKYEEAEVVAARIAAAKMAFFTKAQVEGAPDDGEDSEGNLSVEATPGGMMELPTGYDVKPWTPEHPNTAYKEFGLVSRICGFLRAPVSARVYDTGLFP
jgi:lambda family phage portal protein